MPAKIDKQKVQEDLRKRYLKKNPAPDNISPEEYLNNQAIKYGTLLKNNKIYAFREPTEDERVLEVMLGEKLFYPPNPVQAKILDAWTDQTKKVFTMTGANRIGKTTLEAIIAFSVMFGRWLWNDNAGGERALIPFSHKKARKIRFVGQAWETHIKTVVIPKLKEWWPKNRPLETKKNNQGIEATWKDISTGSTLEIMSNSQESDVFEGWDGDLVVYDEPPSRDIRIACARGLIDRGGRELFGATLLKEAWIHREVIRARLEDGKPDLSIFNVTGDIVDNVGFGLKQEDIDQFAKTLKPEEKEARLRGKPSYLSTLVFPKFNRDIHVKPSFKIPLDAIVDISIDFHPSKKWAVVFLATLRNNFKYVCNEIWENGNPKYISESITRIVKAGQYRVGKCIIDPLSKSGMPNDNDVFGIVSDVLASYGIGLEVASKDKNNGIAYVNNLLWTENEMPGLWMFDTCPMTIQQTEDLMYDPDNLKPTAMKVDDDFTECLYRLALLDTQWYPEKIFDMSKQRSVIL